MTIESHDLIVLLFIRRFPEFYKEIGGNQAAQYLGAVFASCYSVLTMEERARVMVFINQMAYEVGEEKFEDGLDFVSFVQEIVEES